MARSTAGRVPKGVVTPATCAAANLVLCLPFEDSTVDLSPQHDIVISQGVTYGPGPVGRAVTLDVTSRIDVAESPALDLVRFTIEAWVNLARTPVSSAVGLVDNETQYAVFLDPSQSFRCIIASAASLPVAVLPLGEWHHVACTYDQVTLAGYLDGRLVASEPHAVAPSTAGTTGLSVGANNPNMDPQGRLVGSLDEVRIFSEARSATEVCLDAGKPNCP